MKYVMSMLALAWALASPQPAAAETIRGRVLEGAGVPLPGVTVEAREAMGTTAVVVSDEKGEYRFDVPRGTYELQYRLIGFAREVRKHVHVANDMAIPDVRLSLAIDADVVVTASRTFAEMVGVETVGPTTIGTSSSASSGLIARREIETRPALRPGDVLESVPGLLVSQHSGEGKANQFYLRGFNLDHGTDFAVRIAGTPVNLPTHGHGQGYADTNFLIPELISGIQFRKGPYYAEQGDFSSAGAANISYLNSLDQAVIKLEGGGYDYRRVLLAGSTDLGVGTLLFAGEVVGNDGPWTVSEEMERLNGVLRFSHETPARAFHLTAMAYDSTWTAADQIPMRAVDDGRLDRFDSIDMTDGGETHRTSLSGEYQLRGLDSTTRYHAYAMDYALDLYSNFTYFLDDPVNGDQFEQVDDRMVFGGGVEHRMLSRVGEMPVESAVGLDLRYDDIAEVGLHRTRERERVSTIRSDSVDQWSAGAFAQSSISLRDWLRVEGGLRADFYKFDTRGSIAANSGSADDVAVSPKLGLILGPWRSTELYFNAGQGFHSNDGRGSVTRIDPVSGEAVQPADPLVRTNGAEIGIRSSAFENFAFTTAAWMLDIDSELLFIGDAGTTEASRPSRRWGVEVDASYHILPNLVADADLAWTRAGFRDDDPAGRLIPGSPEAVGSLGLLYIHDRANAQVRYRYFGPRPLEESGKIESGSSGLVDLRVSVPLLRYLVVEASVYNVLDASASDIDYYYTSRLPGEPADGVDGIHTHPVVPRTIRIGLRLVL